MFKCLTSKAVSTGMKKVWKPGLSNRENLFFSFTWLVKFLTTKYEYKIIRKVNWSCSAFTLA